MRALRTRLIALLTAFAVLFPGGAFARTQYFCHMMGRVTEACCCEEEQQTSESTCEAKIRARSCCERISSSTRATMSSTREQVGGVVGAAFVSILSEPIDLAKVPSLPSNAMPPLRTRAPPALGPPLFVAHCAFLL